MVGLALGAMGCGQGKVKADALDFGRARSAVWMERKLTTEVGDAHTHDFVLTTVPGWCRKAQDAHAELSLAWKDVQQAIVDNPTDATAQCEAQHAFYAQAATVTGPFFDKGLSVVHLALRDPNETADVPPYVGPYDAVGYDEVSRYIVATVAQYTANPYQLYADTADCVEKPGFWESDAYDALFDIYTGWTLSDGSAEVDDAGDKAYRVDLEGSLTADLDAEPAGAIELHATFDHCELTWDTEFPEMW